MSGFLGRAWDGQERLWKVYWLGHVLFSIVFSLALYLLFKISPYIAGSAAAGYMGYYVWMIVSLWRCAFNAEWTFWGYVVRALILLKPFMIVIFAIMGVLVGQDLIHSAECRKELTAKGIEEHVGFNLYRAQHPDEWKACLAEKKSPLNPSNSLPVVMPVVMAPAVSDLPPAYTNACEQKMADYAVREGVDPKAYIAQNQAYLAQCNQQAGGAH